MSMPRKTILIILAFFAIYVIWGSTYLLNKIVVTEVSPLYLASLRFTVASILIFIIAKALKLNLAITPKQLKNNIFAGFLFLVYGNGVFVWALKYVDSGFGALIASIQPLMVLVLMRLIDGKKIWTFKSDYDLIKSQKKLSIVYDDSKVYFNNSKGDIYALDKINGNLVWLTPTRTDTESLKSFLIKSSHTCLMCSSLLGMFDHN